MILKTWYRSLKKAIRKYNDDCVRRWPNEYRRATDAEIKAWCDKWRHKLRGPVKKIICRRLSTGDAVGNLYIVY
jgi:hypothetical protein